MVSPDGVHPLIEAATPPSCRAPNEPAMLRRRRPERHYIFLLVVRHLPDSDGRVDTIVQ